MANITRTSQIDQTARGMLGEAPKDGDLVLIKDVSDATSGGGGRDKYVTVSNLVKSVGSVSGLAGSPGVQGPRGPQGPKGDKGDQGIQGLNGLSGQDGARGPQGIQGQRGAPGPTGISPAGLAWQGTWASGRSYEVNDTVAYEGASYFCITGNSGTTPPDQSANFALLAAQGADGAPGADGADGAAGVQGPRGNQGEVGPQGPAGPAGADGVQGADGVAGEAGQRGPQGEAGEAGATVFTELDQIPDNLNPGAYLRVNDSGDGLVNVMTAPPDGGISTNRHVNGRNNTGVPIPDKVAFIWNSHYYWLDFDTITEGDNGAIFYHRDIGDNDYMRIVFKNQPGGPNVGDGTYINTTTGKSRYYPNASHSASQNHRDIRTKGYTLEQFVDPSKRPTNDNDEMVHFSGTKSGTSGAGNLNVIKAVSNFYTELPDAIVHNQSGDEHILRLDRVLNDHFIYRNEDHGSQDRRIYFDNSDEGTVSSNTEFYTGVLKLKEFIENGRALYYGSQPSTSRVGQAEDVRDVVSLASSIELPDAILDHDANLDGDARVLIFEKYTSGHFQYHATNPTSFYVRFDATTGAQVQKSTNSNGDFSSIQEYISNGRALYFGGTSNAGIGVTKFTGLEDTPATLSANKILKTNSTGDQIILVDDTPSEYLAASFTGNPVLNGVQGAVGTNGVASSSQDILEALLDDSLESGVYTYGHGTHGGTALTLTMPSLTAGQQVEIYHYKGSAADKDIQFNGANIGAIGDGTKRWSSPLTAISGTNRIHLPLTSTTGGANALGIFQIKIDGEVYKGMGADSPIRSINDLTDVQTSGTGHEPEDGDILVWNESHGHWMPGKATGGGSVSDISGLIRHYNLDGNLDDVTNTAHLTSEGDALSYESGKYNQAVKLNGTNNKLKTGLVLPTDSTISLWYKHNDKTGGSNLYLFGDFASSGGNASSSVSLRIIPTNQIQVLARTSASGLANFESPSAHSEWHHAVIARSGSNWKFYLDGSEVHSGTFLPSSKSLAFGHFTAESSSATGFFGGWLDNIRIYNKQLTASEVTTLYNQ